MKTFSQKMLVNTFYIIAIAILILSYIMVYRQILYLRDAHLWVRHTNKVLRTLDQAAINFADNDDNQFKNNMLVVKNLTLDNTAQQKLNDQILSLFSTISKGKNNKNVIITLKNQITSLIFQMKTNELMLLNKRSINSDDQFRLSKIMSVIAAIISTLILIITLVLLNYYLNKRQRMEKSLEKSERYKTAILDAVSDSIILVDESGYIQSYNPQTISMFKLSSTELINQNIDTLILDINLKMGDTPQNHPLELIAITKQKEKIYVEVHISKIFVDNKNLYVIIVRDINEQKVHTNIILKQQEAIRKLATPILQLHSKILILPIVGEIDAQRANQITEQLLHTIRDKRTKVVVMDITGVTVVDSLVANSLIQTIDSAKLMGAMVIISGLSAEVAYTLVKIGIDLSRINSVGDLQSGVEFANKIIAKNE